ncbi:MAG: RluA family pseudouridine synthase [Nitrospinae bacterium]|nr:RluA family pseudouridine synthase [Nitrospinota bacterium]
MTCREGAKRVDSFLAQSLKNLSRSRVQGLIRDGMVSVDGRVETKTAHALPSGARVVVMLPPPAPSHIEAEKIALDVRYEDEHLLVINKPPGMVVHPGAGQRKGTLAAALLHHCRGQLSGIGGVERPGIVHRLDKDTSGLLIAAKTDAAHGRLSADLKARRIHRHYLAIVRGTPPQGEGTIDAPIGRHPAHRTAMAVVGSGRRAVTHYAVREVLEDASLLGVTLETGRTHQIRVHMSHIGHPVLGDPVYGLGRLPRGSRKKSKSNQKSLIERQALHAHRLAFRHPIDGGERELMAEPPADFLKLLESLRA